ncbi:MAG: ABC transporter permease, partial [Myxococcales bacterium]|nr:ABC transporter permease [Myxococcales bacterium]
MGARLRSPPRPGGSAPGRVARRGGAPVNRALRRLGAAFLVLVGVVTIAFFIARELPGDPVRMIVGPQASAADVARARAIYGLDEPALAQYLRFWQRLLHGPDRGEHHDSCSQIGPWHVDLGYSYRYRKPVTKLLADKAPRSLELALGAVALQVLLGLGLGVAAARRRGRLFDQLLMGTTLVTLSAPIFALGLALQYLLAHRLAWLPLDGYGDTPADHLRSLVLPALTLGIFGAAYYTRIVRQEVGGELDRDYLRQVVAKGAGPLRVTVAHALRNALLPILTLMVLDLGALIGGAIVTEKLFRWPGLGA